MNGIFSTFHNLLGYLLILFDLILIFPVFSLSEIKYNLQGKPGEGYGLDVLIGTPPQKLNVLVDTGSTNFAIASSPLSYVSSYFYTNSSSTYENTHRTVEMNYTQGELVSELGHDIISFPSFKKVPPVKTTVAFIFNAHNIFINGSDWQGILGLGYPAISQPSKEVHSWIDEAYDKRKQLGIPGSFVFALELCGLDENNKLKGLFEVFDILPTPHQLKAPLIREWFYEVTLVGLSVGGEKLSLPCQTFNSDKAIVDSGTTSLRLPKNAHDALHDRINTYMDGHGLIISADFWAQNKMACLSQPLNWTLFPKISLSVMADKNNYFDLTLPPKSYIRLLHKNESSLQNEFCYKFAIEPSTTGTVLGLVAMEGFRMVFNRTEKFIGFSKSSCGPDVSLEGPFRSQQDLSRCSSSFSGVHALTVAAYIIGGMISMLSLMLVLNLVPWEWWRRLPKPRFQDTESLLSQE